MKSVGARIVVLILCAFVADPLCAAAEQPSVQSAPLYDSDPRHLWNRLHRALFVTTTSDGSEYGLDNSAVLTGGNTALISAPRHQELIAMLDEFAASREGLLPANPIQRAILQNDLWAAFDAFTHPWRPAPEDKERLVMLQQRLAKAIWKLALSSHEIKELPDNYLSAVQSETFSKSHDPEHPERPFLPPDLFDPKGPWVLIEPSSAEQVTGRIHVEALSGRSGFEVFIRLPGGREETLAYLKGLNLFPTPWKLEPAALAKVVSTGEQVRWDPLELHRETPQFPAGTMVALVRRMVLVSGGMEPVISTLVQGVQLRVYRRIPKSFLPANEARETQDFYEFVMRRRKLFDDEAGGLHAIGKEEREPQLLFRTHGETEQERLGGHIVLTTCIGCHSAPGIFSVNSYSRFAGRQVTNPQLLPATDADYTRRRVTDWKRQQFNWGMLKGLLLSNSEE